MPATTPKDEPTTARTGLAGRLALSAACALGASALSGTEVLILTDRTGPGIDALSAGLTAHGLHAVVSPILQAAFTGDSPSLAPFQVVVHVNGSSIGEAMPLAGQQALDAFVRNGGGFVQAEWNSIEFSKRFLSGMRELTLFDPTGQLPSSTLSLEVCAGEEDHPLLAGLPPSFEFTTAWTISNVHLFADQPAEVVMRGSWGNDAVAARSYGAGRVVGFTFAARGDDATALGDPLVQQLYANAAHWVAGVHDSPAISLNQPDQTLISYRSSYSDPGATAYDLKDGDLTSAIVVTGAIDTASLGPQSLTYSVSDSDGNRSTAVRTVRVVDVTPPVIQLRRSADVALALNAAYADPGATALDDHDGDLTRSVVMSGSVDTGHAGVYFLTFSVSDSSGNAASATRVVTVYAPPAVTCTVALAKLPFQGGGLSDVGLQWSATSGRGLISITCAVTQDEKLSSQHDATLTLANGLPDHLALRCARVPSNDGRVYLVTITAIDDLGQVGQASCTVVVPKGGSAKQMNDVLAQAAADLAAASPLPFDSFGMPSGNG